MRGYMGTMLAYGAFLFTSMGQMYEPIVMQPSGRPHRPRNRQNKRRKLIRSNPHLLRGKYKKYKK